MALRLLQLHLIKFNDTSKKLRSACSKYLIPTMQTKVIDPRVKFLTPERWVQRLDTLDLTSFSF